MLLPLCNLIRLNPEQKLYKQREKSNTYAYLIIHGFINLIDDTAGGRKIGGLTMGDSVGEETILEDQFLKSSHRLETAIANSETFLFEIDSVNFKAAVTQMKETEHGVDAFTLVNYFKM